MARKSRRCDGLGCCIIDADPLNGADSDDPGSKWDEAGGADYDLSAGSLLVANPSGGNYILMFTTPHPGGKSAPVEVSVEFMLDDLTDSAGFLVSVDSASNPTIYLAGKVNSTPGCATIDLADDGSLITSTNNVPGLHANQWHKMKLCYFPGDEDYDPGLLRMRVDLANGRVYGDQLINDYHQSLNTDGRYVGLIGDPGVRFRNFFMKWGRDPDAYLSECKEFCSDCNTPCLIELDDFTFDDACKWSVISGSWTRDFAGSMEAKCLSGGVMLCAVHHPQDKTSHYVTCLVWCSTSVKGLVLVNAKSDGSSYHWAELSMDAYGVTLTLKIGKDGVTLASASGSFVANQFYLLTVCYDAGTLTATVGSLTATTSSTAVANGTYAGLAGVLGGERFRNFRFEKHRSFTDPPDPKCPNCPEAVVGCVNCVNDQAPRYFVVEFSGMGNSANCADCDAVINGLFAVDMALIFDMDCGEPVGGGCTGYSEPFPFCIDGLGGASCASIRVVVGANVGGNYSLYVQVVYEFASSPGCPHGEFGTGFGCQVLFTFKLTQNQKFDCLNFDGLEIPFQSEDGNCNAASATCRIWTA